MNRLSAVSLTVAVVATSACVSAPPQAPENSKAAGAVAALVAGHAVVTDDVVFVDDGVRVVGKDAVVERLAGAHLALASTVNSHHDVLRARVTRGGDARMLFGEVDSAGAFRFVVVIRAPGAVAGPASVAALNDYQAAWNVADSAERDRLLSSSFAAEGHYVDPTVDAPSRAALAQNIVNFRDKLPGAAVTAASDVVVEGGVAHFRWLTTGLFGLVNVEGMDIVFVDDNGVITFVGGFFGPLP